MEEQKLPNAQWWVVGGWDVAVAFLFFFACTFPIRGAGESN